MLFRSFIAWLWFTAVGGSSDIHGARSHLLRGVAALEATDYETARAALEQARQLAPHWALAHLHWGILENTVDPDNPQVLEALYEAVRLAPKNPRAWYHLGLALERAGHLDEALKAFQAARRLRPTMHETVFRMATILRAKGDKEKAVAFYKRYLEEKPNHLGSLAALAELYEATGQGGQAERALRSIAELQPSVAYHLYQLAEFYLRRGEKRKARRTIRQANRIDPRPQRRMRRLR